MEEYWGTRTGRWRRAMLNATAPSLAERLYAVIRVDVEKGQLPAGALLPTAGRVAAELAIEPADVEAAYTRLLAEGLLETRDGAAHDLRRKAFCKQRYGLSSHRYLLFFLEPLLFLSTSIFSLIPYRRNKKLNHPSLEPSGSWEGG